MKERKRNKRVLVHTIELKSLKFLTYTQTQKLSQSLYFRRDIGRGHEVLGNLHDRTWMVGMPPMKRDENQRGAHSVKI